MCLPVGLSKVHHGRDEDMIKPPIAFVSVLYSRFCTPSALVSHLCCTKVMQGMKMSSHTEPGTIRKSRFPSRKNSLSPPLDRFSLRGSGGEPLPITLLGTFLLEGG